MPSPSIHKTARLGALAIAAVWLAVAGGLYLVFEQIERRYGVQIDRATVDLYAAALPARLTKSLQVGRDTPCLVVIRRYYDRQGELFEISVTHHPEGRFVYSLEYRRSDLGRS